MTKTGTEVTIPDARINPNVTGISVLRNGHVRVELDDNSWEEWGIGDLAEYTIKLLRERAALASVDAPATGEQNQGRQGYCEICNAWPMHSAGCYCRQPAAPADAPAPVEPVAWRWRPKGANNWIYDPEPDWLARQGFTIEKEPLYAAPVVKPHD